MSASPVVPLLAQGLCSSERASERASKSRPPEWRHSGSISGVALLLRHIRSAGSGPILTAVIVGLAAAPALSGEIEIRESELKFGLSLLRRRRRRRRQNERKIQ